MAVKLAEALLRRKELEGKVKQLLAVKTQSLFEVKAQRVKVTDSIDDLVLTVPKVTISQITAEYDFYSRQLRLCDAAIQQLNWTVQVPDHEVFMRDFVAQEKTEKVVAA